MLRGLCYPASGNPPMSTPRRRLISSPPLSRHRAIVPFGVSVLLAAALILSGLANLRSVRSAVEGHHQAWVADLGLQVHQAIYGFAFLRTPEELHKALANLVQGPVEHVALLDKQGRTLVAEPTDDVPAASRAALARFARAPGKPRVHRLSGGSHPVYEIFLVLRPKLPAPLRKRILEHLSKMSPQDRRLFGTRAIGPQAVFLRAVIRVRDDAAVRAISRARTVHVVGVVAALLLLFVGSMAFYAERRRQWARWAMERQRALAETGEMAAVLAHEIRNPVGIIQGRAQLLLEENDAPDRDALRTLVEQTARLDRLVTRLLDFAHPASPNPEPLQTDALAEQAVQAVSDLAVSRQVAIVPDLEPADLLGDPEMLLRALVNLLQNAIHVSPPGGRVTLRHRKRGAHSVFTILDDGPGLPEGAGEEIFKPFVTTREDGSGLGLAIVRRIAEAHGGSVSAADEPGRGARFDLTLPRRRGPPQPDA